MKYASVFRKIGKSFAVTVGFLVFLVLPVFGVWKAVGKIYSSIIESPHPVEAKNESKKNDTNTSDIHKDTVGDAQSEPSVVGGVTNIISAIHTASYPVHRDITATVFWVGEPADDDNKDISNAPSAWDDAWLKHFGGVDDPKNRKGLLPADFAPKENPFYVALPYNDFNKNGNRRPDVTTLVPWAHTQPWKDGESMLKNRWIKIAKGNMAAYAQWEDVGPFKENDGAYVFGSAAPASKTNKRAGIDLSPALNQYLNLKDIDQVDWQFVDAQDVPDGPWKHTVTTSQVYWN
jgi:hypothetical protein